jgi:hypothetical protein
MKVVTKHLYMSGMSYNAESTVQAAVAYAEKNKDTAVHNLSLSEFLTLTNLPKETTRTQVVSILAETRRATMTIRVTENSAIGKKELLSGSWAMFIFILITDSHVSFEVCPYSWEDFD